MYILILLLLAVFSNTSCSADSVCPDNECTEPSGEPDRDGDGLDDEEELRLGTDPDRPDSDGDGLLDGAEVELKSDPNAFDQACTSDLYSADFRARPVDVIFVIDNSGSMRDEIDSVERNINENFADIMTEAGLDFRVVMLSKHGTHDTGLDSDICVRSPLSATACDPVPDSPANSTRFFHYDFEISSDDSFDKILETYNRPGPHGLSPGGWSDFLRPEAFKVFIEITDDSPEGLNAAEFERRLFELNPPNFGNSGGRNYVWHSIVGLYPRESDPTSAYPASEPLTDFQCGTSESPGIEYQKLSIVTGGLRYPVCEFETYESVFRAAAVKTVEDADIDCELNMPIAPEGQRIDPSRMVLQFKDDTGRTIVVRQVAGAQACRADAFYIEGDAVKICPELCPSVSSSQQGSLEVLAQCTPQTCENPRPEICDDGIDNDCDGFIDRRDIECFL